MNERHKPRKTIVQLGKEATNVILSVPPKIAFLKQRPRPSPPVPPTEQYTSHEQESHEHQETPDPYGDKRSEGVSETKLDPTEQISEAVEALNPITLKTTPGDAKAATNPIVILLVIIAGGLAILGLIVMLFGAPVVGVSISTLGILLIIGIVLSPKMKRQQ